MSELGLSAICDLQCVFPLSSVGTLKQEIRTATRESKEPELIMAIYAISDLHLSFANPKPMDVFSPVWVNHAEKVARNWDSLVTDDDIVLMPGDLSWAMRLSEARPDLKFVRERRGRKVLTRGNHDYWWQRRATPRIQQNYAPNMFFLQGTSAVIGDVGITGTRGWRLEKWMTDANVDPKDEILRDVAQSEKILRRELNYLENGLKSIPESVKMKIAMLHFPPFDERLQPNEFSELLQRYSVDVVVYGHVHLGNGNWLSGDVNGIQHFMVSADIVDFVPQLILP